MCLKANTHRLRSVNDRPRHSQGLAGRPGRPMARRGEIRILGSRPTGGGCARSLYGPPGPPGNGAARRRVTGSRRAVERSRHGNGGPGRLPQGPGVGTGGRCYAANLNALTGDEGPEYITVNHQDPDVTGNLPALCPAPPRRCHPEQVLREGSRWCAVLRAEIPRPRRARGLGMTWRGWVLSARPRDDMAWSERQSRQATCLKEMGGLGRAGGFLKGQPGVLDLAGREARHSRPQPGSSVHTRAGGGCRG